MFTGVNHVAVICSNLEKSLRFYIDTLKLKEISRIRRPERESTIVYLDAGNTVIELFSFPHPPKRLSYPEAVGLRHVAFSTRNFDKTLEVLKVKGVTYEEPRVSQSTGKRMTFIFDPDQLPIEISEI